MKQKIFLKQGIDILSDSGTESYVFFKAKRGEAFLPFILDEPVIPEAQPIGFFCCRR